MNCNKKVELYQVTAIPNKMGGYSKGEVLVGTINACINPEKTELTIINDVVVAITTIKAFTKDELPTMLDFIVSDNIKYKVLAVSNHAKVKMLTLEKVAD